MGTLHYYFKAEVELVKKLSAAKVQHRLAKLDLKKKILIEFKNGYFSLLFGILMDLSK